MKYKIIIIRAAEKEMDKIPAAMYTRISSRILSLEDRPRPVGSKKLSSREEYRLRVGDYRILYIIDDKVHMVTIIAIGHRGEIYR